MTQRVFIIEAVNTAINSEKKSILIDRKEASEILNVSVNTLRNWEQKKIINIEKRLSNRVYYLRSEIERLIKAR